MKKLPKLALFDLDGTLIEFHHNYLFDQTHFLLAKMGFPAVSEDILSEAFAAFDYFRFIEEIERDCFIEQFWGLFDWDNFPTPKPFSGVSDVLSKLVASGVNVSIVTSRYMPVAQLREMLEGTEILQHVSHIRTRPGDHIHWTDKRGLIREVCEESGIPPEDAVMVGDIPTDIISARDVGVGFNIAVLSGGVRKDILEQAKPDLILSGVESLHVALGID